MRDKMKSYSTDWLLLTCSMKKQKQDFVLILWSSVDTPLKFRPSFRVFFYLLDMSFGVISSFSLWD